MPQFKIQRIEKPGSTLGPLYFRVWPTHKRPQAVLDALLLQLFMQLLEAAAFNWYANLPEASIVSW